MTTHPLLPPTMGGLLSRFAQPRAWQVNTALCLIGLGMIGIARQLVVEYDSSHYFIGLSGCSSSHLVLYAGALLILWLFPRSTNRYTVPIILAVAILCRLVLLFPDPVLSSDVYRYAWDGVVQHAHINPYRYVPGDAHLAFLREPHDDLYSNMNRKDYAHTIYPPAAQLAFYLITWISPTVTFMKMAMVLFEGLTLWGLAQLCRALGFQREWILLYAWCPLPIWEFAGSGHVDAMVIALLVLAILFRVRRRPVLTGLFLGLAVLTKFYPLVLFPAMYQRGDWKMPATMAALAAVTYSAYLSAGKLVFGFLGGYVQEEGMASGARYWPLEFAQHLPGLHALPNAAFLLFAAVVLSALTVWAWRTSASPRPAAFLGPAAGLAMALMLLFSPHYPWYVAWLIPFFLLTPSLTVMTYVCGLFYLCTTALAVGTGPKQYLLNEILYSAVLIVFLVELALRRWPLSQRWFRPLPSLVSDPGTNG